MKFRKTQSGSYYWHNNSKRYSLNPSHRYTNQGMRSKWTAWVKTTDHPDQVIGLYDTANEARQAAVDHHNGANTPIAS